MSCIIINYKLNYKKCRLKLIKKLKKSNSYKSYCKKKKIYVILLLVVEITLILTIIISTIIKIKGIATNHAHILYLITITTMIT